MRTMRWLFVLGVAAVAAGCSYSGDADPYRPPASARLDADATGRELYLGDCAWCHGNAGQGTDRGPDLDGPLDGPAYTHFMLSTGRMPIADPAQTTLRRDPVYSDEQIEEIVEFVTSLGGAGPEIPDPHAPAGDLALGTVLYEENCAACHSSTGVGGALTSGRIAPSLDGLSAVQIAEAMLVGPGCLEGTRTCEAGEGAMPVFEFDDHEVDSIVAYVDHLMTSADRRRGGSDLGGLGPVTEGAIAWIVGLGILLLFTRWIGTRVGDE
jgi:ubiquinol-cytochrome c reductase cytochrome c subunit